MGAVCTCFAQLIACGVCFTRLCVRCVLQTRFENISVLGCATVGPLQTAEAYTVMAYIAMVYMDMAYFVCYERQSREDPELMVYVVVASIVMAYIIMACMARTL